MSTRKSKSSNAVDTEYLHKLSEDAYPITPDSPLRPSMEKDEWTTIVKKSRKKRGVEHEPIPHAPSIVHMSNPEEEQEAIDALIQTKKERKKTLKEKRQQALAINQQRWTKGNAYVYINDVEQKIESINTSDEKNDEIDQKLDELQQLYEKEKQTVSELEMSLVRFFRPGYEKYKTKLLKALYETHDMLENNDDNDNNDISENAVATDAEVLTCIKGLFRKYKLLVSGGFVIKYIAQMDDRTKPSVDVDIYVPNNTPKKYSSFYKTMARLFCCDRVPNKKGHMVNHIDAFITKGAGVRTSFFKKNGIYSVFKHKRNVMIDGKNTYAEMDLVRASTARTPENIIRNFDLSCCMNWYDGAHLYSMDPQSIIDPSNHPSYLHFGYVPIFFGLSGESMKEVSRGRILKYMMRGFRIQYVNPKTGEVTEISTTDMPNALEHLLQTTNRNKRAAVFNLAMQKIYASNKSHKRASFLEKNPKFKNLGAIPSPKKKNKTRKVQKVQSPYKPRYNANYHYPPAI